MNISMQKTALAALTAFALIAGLAVPASAQHYRGGGDVGAGIAAGILGGAMLGAAAANAGPGPGYVEDAPDCWMERRPVYDDDGNFVGRRRVRVCR
jgi:hypothetical protein